MHWLVHSAFRFQFFTTAPILKEHKWQKSHVMSQKLFVKFFFVKFCMRCEKFKDQALPISECQVFPAIILRNPDEYYSDQSQRKVWKSGGGVVVMLCSAPVWKRLNWFYKIGRGGRLPPWSPRSYGPVWCMGSNVSLYEIEFDFFFTNVSQFFYE